MTEERARPHDFRFFAFTATAEDLREWFSEFGEVTKAQVTMDRETGRSRGFAFVEMESDADAQAAIKAMDGVQLDGPVFIPKFYKCF